MAEISGVLPQASQDEQRLCADLDEFGYCLVADAIPKATLEEIHTRVREQAEEERSRGLTPLDDVQTTSGEDGNQYVYMLINKGQVFQELLRQPRIHSLIGHVLGEQYLLSDLGAIITHPSNRQMGMHIDQWFLPTPTRPGRPERRSGSITRRNLHTGPPDINPDLINAPVVCNVLWMISDFSIENGATRAVPGSHLSGCSPDPSNPPETVNLTGPAGTAIVFEGRTWHAADFNRSPAPRYAVVTYYCVPMLRQMTNFTYGTRRDVIDTMAPDLLPLLGFKPWGGIGATGDPHGDLIQRGEDSLGELSPSS